MPSRTTWLVITIFGLLAFIVGGGVALFEDMRPSPPRTEATQMALSPSLATPEETPSVSLAESLGDDGGEGKAKGHSKAKGSKAKDHGQGNEAHGKAKGHDKAGHGHGKHGHGGGEDD